MSYPLYSWNLEPTISFSWAGNGSGVIGNPALAIDSSQNTYFAAVVIGQNPTASPSVDPLYRVYNNIVVGSTDRYGNLLWYKFFPELVVDANQSQVSLVVGKNNDLYVAFVTPYCVYGCYNMETTPGWCPPLYQPSPNSHGPYDIVLARINYTTQSQTVAWVIQNAQINSVWDETSPQLAIDTNNGLLYIAYQTTGDILCYTAIGSSNVILSCFTLNGKQLWLESQGNINSAGANTNPTVAADNQGGVYLAYETTATVSGGATITNQQVEMVKFQTYLNPNNTLASYSRQWVLSQYSNIFTPVPGTSSSPSLACDGTSVYLAFLTTGSVGGNIPTGSMHDLVVTKITPAGLTVWIQQGNQFNRTPYIYSDAGYPYITADSIVSPGDTPNILVSLQTYTEAPQEGDTNVFVFKMSAITGNNMFDVTGFNALPIASSIAGSTALLPTAGAGAYSQVAVKAIYNVLYFLLGSLIPLRMNTPTSCEADLILLKYNLVTYYATTSPFQFMSKNKKICSCGANCGCSSGAVIPGAPANLVGIPGNNSALIYFTINDGNSPIINYSYSINGGAFLPLVPAQYSSPLTIPGLTNGLSFNIQIRATNGIGVGFPSATVVVIPGTPAPPTNLSIVPGNSSAVATFTPGADNGSSITNYLNSLNGGTTFTAFSPAQTTSPLTISPLTNGVSYTIQIKAVNSVGTSLASSNLYITPGTPSTPTNVVATSGASSVVVTFTPSTAPVGYPVTNYEYSKNGGLSFIPFSPSITSGPVIISGLVNGVTYNIQLRAINNIGHSQPSTNFPIIPGLPAPPTALSYTSGYQSVTITFTPGASNGSPIQNYAYSLHGGCTIIGFTPFDPPTGNVTSVTFNSLTNYESYDIQLEAINGIGTGLPSATITVVPQPQPLLYLDAALYTSGSTWSNTGTASSALDMTLSGTYSKTTDGGGSILFGTDTLAQTPSVSTNISTRTLNIWIKLTDTANIGGGFGLVAPSNYESVDWNQQNAGWMYGSFNNSRSGSGGQWGTVQPQGSSTGYYNNSWHMITAVYANDYTMYVDGIPSFTITQADQIAYGPNFSTFLQIFGSDGTGAYTYYLGPNDGGSAQPNNSIVGKIALAYVFNQELTSDDILSLYNYTQARFAPTPLVLLQGVNYNPATPAVWADQSGNGNNASLGGGTGAANASGNAVVLDGSTWWTFPDIYAGNTWTLAVWYKNSAAPQSQYASIVTGGFNTNINMFLACTDVGTQTFQGGFYNGSFAVGAPFIISNDSWNCYQIVWDGTTLFTYVNGVMIGTTTPPGPSGDSAGNLNYIIGRVWDQYLYVTGEIGTVTIYGVPLTPVQIYNNYNSTLPMFKDPDAD